MNVYRVIFVKGLAVKITAEVEPGYEYTPSQVSDLVHKCEKAIMQILKESE